MENVSYLAAGTKLKDKYTIEKVLGAGGFGITYLASMGISMGSFEAKAYVAIKEHFISALCERNSVSRSVTFSQPVSEQVEGFRRDFVAEAKRLQSCSEHRNIVKVNEVFEENNTAYYVMEYLEGKSLADYVNSKRGLSEQEAVRLMMPILSAVDFLHAKHMTHLDIKPANIMICEEKNGNVQPVLIDFGLAKHYDEDGTPTSTINGQGISHGFAPIEQYAGISTFQPRADIYALGATLLYCITGRHPDKATEIEIDQVVAKDLREGSPAMRHVIGIAMQAKPANRFQQVSQMMGVLGNMNQLSPNRYSNAGEAVAATPVSSAPISGPISHPQPSISYPQQPRPVQQYPQQPVQHPGSPMPGQPVQQYPQQPMPHPGQPMPRPGAPMHRPGPMPPGRQGPMYPQPGPQQFVNGPRPPYGQPAYPPRQPKKNGQSGVWYVIGIVMATLFGLFLFGIILALLM